VNGSETEKENGRKKEGKDRGVREREGRQSRVNEPWMFALFAEFIHYRNTLLVPMVRSGSSGSVVHGELRTEPAGDMRRQNILYNFGFHAWRSARSTRRCYLPKSARIMIIGNAKL